MIILPVKKKIVVFCEKTLFITFRKKKKNVKKNEDFFL